MVQYCYGIAYLRDGGSFQTLQSLHRRGKVLTEPRYEAFLYVNGRNCRHESM